MVWCGYSQTRDVGSSTIGENYLNTPALPFSSPTDTTSLTFLLWTSFNLSTFVESQLCLSYLLSVMVVYFYDLLR